MDGKSWKPGMPLSLFRIISLSILFSPSLSLVASFNSCLSGNGKDEKEVARCFPLRLPLQPWLNSINPEIPAERVI